MDAQSKVPLHISTDGYLTGEAENSQIKKPCSATIVINFEKLGTMSGFCVVASTGLKGIIKRRGER